MDPPCFNQHQKHEKQSKIKLESKQTNHNAGREIYYKPKVAEGTYLAKPKKIAMCPERK